MPHSQPFSTRFSLVMPAFNEAEVIATAIEEAVDALQAAVPEYEIIIVDDGSSDETAAIVRSICNSNPRVQLIRHSSNQGYGAALRNGFAAASGELIAFTDADCQFDLSEIDRFLLLSRSYDAVCGYRIDRQDSWLRCFYSQVYNWIVRILLGIRVRDVDCALKVFRREVLAKAEFRSTGFLVNSDLLTKITADGGRIVEVGVTHRPRAAGQSTVSIRHIPVVLMSLARLWWNQFQFPDAAKSDDVGPTGDEHRRLGWMQLGLIVAACVFLFANLGHPLIDRDETRYAEIPREMLVTGEWALPTLNFSTYYDKPPMLYWLVAISYSIFGVHEWSARLVPAISALGTLLMVIWFGNRHFGRKVGLVSGGVLALTAGFAFCSRYLLIDGLLTLTTTVSLMAGYEAVCSKRGGAVDRWWWGIACLACGMGFLTKGPIAIVLLLPIVLAHAWLTDGAAKVRLLHVMTLFAVAGAMSLPWMVVVSLKDGNFLWEFFVNHNARRFVGKYHDRPFWFFVPVLLAAGFPWSFLTIPFVKSLFSRSETARVNRPPVSGFLCLWALWVFLFFSMSRCKLPTYLLPITPALALLLGPYLVRLTRPDVSIQRMDRIAQFWSARWAAITACCLGAGMEIFRNLSGEFGWPGHMTVVVWIGLLGGVLFLFRGSKNRHRAWTWSAAISVLLTVATLHHVVPAYSRSQSIFAEFDSVSAITGDRDFVAVATVAHEFSEVPYYLGRQDIENFSGRLDSKLAGFVQQHATGLLVVHRSILIGELRRHLPQGTRLQSLGFRGPAHLFRISSPDYQLATTKSEDDARK